jgi:hypothetical protein
VRCRRASVEGGRGAEFDDLGPSTDSGKWTDPNRGRVECTVLRVTPVEIKGFSRVKIAVKVRLLLKENDGGKCRSRPRKPCPTRNTLDGCDWPRCSLVYRAG